MPRFSKFLAVQDSSIGDLVTQSLRHVLISESRAEYNHYNHYNHYDHYNLYNHYSDRDSDLDLDLD